MVVCTARAVQCSELGLCSSCCNELFLYVLCNTMIIISGSSMQFNSAGRVRQCLTSEIAVVFAIAYSRFPLSCGTDRSYKLLGRQLPAVLTSEKSRLPAMAAR